MATLGMPGGRFEVRVTPLADGSIAAHGADDVEFLVTANAGQPPAPLSRVASGGELSRLNLAIQVAATAKRGAPTLVFDEVDAGVGGAVAEMVGRRLRELSAGRQVLCITHLPQVATLAEHQATVSKATRAGKTTTAVRLLTPDERVEETARMLGGVKITDQTRAHAEEMLAARQGAASAATRNPHTDDRKEEESRVAPEGAPTGAPTGLRPHVQHQAVVHQVVAMPAGDLALQPLDLLVGELDHPPGLDAHHVIVVPTGLQLEHRVVAGEVVPRDETGLLELRQHPVNRGQAHVVPRLAQAAVDVFGAQVMGPALLQDLENPETGRRGLQACLA